jgi:metal-responsive CopG/Arc/MetJ family transcriptional regulator
MTITVRLSDELTDKLARIAERDGVSKSEVVRRSVEAYLSDRPSTAEIAWEVGKDLFGKHHSGRSDLSERTEEILGDYFDGKRSRP